MTNHSNLQQLAARLSQAIAWEEAVPNSANTAAHIDEIETEAIRSGYSIEDLYSLLDDDEVYARQRNLLPIK